MCHAFLRETKGQGMSKHHAIYMRVSTKRQDTASQEPELKRWAESHEGEALSSLILQPMRLAEGAEGSFR
jgi:hypothetical protein